MNMYEKLRFVRKDLGISQKEVANRMGVGQGTVSKWENGQCEMKVGELMEICKIYEVSPNSIVDLKEIPKGKTDAEINLLLKDCLDFFSDPFVSYSIFAMGLENPIITLGKKYELEKDKGNKNGKK